MSKVLKSYRGLIRAANIAFENDLVTHKAALERFRSEYSEPVEEGDLNRRLQFAKDCAHILRTNVVQGKKNQSKSTGERPVYHLQLHSESELGDNDSRFGSPLGGGAAQGCSGSK